MVDKDGNKVDIMNDLIRLEGDLKAYLKEVDALVIEIKPFDAQHVKLFEEFTADIPKSVKDIRKLRAL